MSHFKRYLKCAALLAVAGAAASCGPAGGPAAGPEARPHERSASPLLAFGRDTLWDDGRAEVSLYTGTTLREGASRPTEARVVIVKEDLLNDQLVKSDRGPLPGRTTEVLKMIVTAEFATGTFFTRQAATVFLQRHALEVVKESASSFDGCGLTTVRAGPANGRFLHEAHSYWEGEADRVVEVLWPLEDVPRLWWDALPLWLRAAVASGKMPPRAWMMPSQVGSRAPIEGTRPAEASLAMSDGGALEVPAGRFARTVRVEVTSGGKTDSFWFDAAWPHVMVKTESAAGRTLALARTLRLAYWKHAAPGDEALLR